MKGMYFRVDTRDGETLLDRFHVAVRVHGSDEESEVVDQNMKFAIVYCSIFVTTPKSRTQPRLPLWGLKAFMVSNTTAQIGYAGAVRTVAFTPAARALLLTDPKSPHYQGYMAAAASFMVAAKLEAVEA
jgi:hypothetical protein